MEESMDIFEISRDDFTQWLAGQTGTVGICQDSCECPLARYLKSRGDDVEVGDDSISLHHGLGCITYWALPEWLRSFVQLVDTGGVCEPITADRARQLLEAA